MMVSQSLRVNGQVRAITTGGGQGSWSREQVKGQVAGEVGGRSREQVKGGRNGRGSREQVKGACQGSRSREPVKGACQGSRSRVRWRVFHVEQMRGCIFNPSFT